MDDRRRAVITGLGVVTPIGLDVPAFWGAALAGKSGVTTISTWDTAGQDVTIGGEIKGFDPSIWIGTVNVQVVLRPAPDAFTLCFLYHGLAFVNPRVTPPR